MNPRPTGHTLGSAHIATPAQSDEELAKRARQTWTCATCGKAIQESSPEMLRFAANVHALACCRQSASAAELPQRESGSSGTE